LTTPGTVTATLTSATLCGPVVHAPTAAGTAHRHQQQFVERAGCAAQHSASLLAPGPHPGTGGRSALGGDHHEPSTDLTISVAGCQPHACSLMRPGTPTPVGCHRDSPDRRDPRRCRTVPLRHNGRRPLDEADQQSAKAPGERPRAHPLATTGVPQGGRLNGCRSLLGAAIQEAQEESVP